GRAPRSRALAAEGAPGLHACLFFHPETVTWAFGAHACAVEIDTETGAVQLRRYAAVHDCGRPINPTVVEGQLHGGSAPRAGAASPGARGGPGACGRRRAPQRGSYRPYCRARYSATAFASASLSGAPNTLIIFVTTPSHCF